MHPLKGKIIMIKKMEKIIILILALILIIFVYAYWYIFMNKKLIYVVVGTACR